jgi:hypothetical protein
MGTKARFRSFLVAYTSYNRHQNQASFPLYTRCKMQDAKHQAQNIRCRIRSVDADRVQTDPTNPAHNRPTRNRPTRNRPTRNRPSTETQHTKLRAQIRPQLSPNSRVSRSNQLIKPAYQILMSVHSCTKRFQV